MWLPDTTHTIWEMKTEKEAEPALQNYFASLINQCIDLNNWLADYSKHYQKWLNDDAQTIFNPESPLLKEMLEAIEQVNRKTDADKHLLYWYDIDRTINENYSWTNCPITGSKLKNLGKTYFYTNRLISEKAGLVLPDKEE